MTEPDLDAPVALAALLSPEERQLLHDAGNDLGVPAALLDRDCVLVLGAPPPPEAAQAQPEAEPVVVRSPAGVYLCGGVFHGGDRLALVCAGPVDEEALGRARYVWRLVDALLLAALRRTLAARVHVATVEDSYRELQEKNRRLEQAIERMHELDRIKANFLATVSHELRTPLTSVIGYSEMLMEGLAGPLNDEQREYLRTVMEKGEQLLALISGILDISRMEAAGVQLHRGVVDLHQLTADVAATVAPQVRRKHLQLDSDVPVDLPPAHGDRDKLRQVLLNLIGNAIKFTQERGRIHVSGACYDDGQGEQVRLSVADTGIGIPSHLHEKIFDPFYQVDNSSTREYEGTGLGLSIVRKFVEAHGGRVWVENREPRGAVFHFTLPVYR
jgi:signal transduction histidine kinase